MPPMNSSQIYPYSLYDRRKIDRELTVLEEPGFPAECADRLPLPFPVAGTVRFPNQAQFLPAEIRLWHCKGPAQFMSTCGCVS